MHCDRLWTDARLAAMAFGIIQRDEFAAMTGRIAYAGSIAEASVMRHADAGLDCARKKGRVLLGIPA